MGFGLLGIWKLSGTLALCVGKSGSRSPRVTSEDSCRCVPVGQSMRGAGEIVHRTGEGHLEAAQSPTLPLSLHLSHCIGISCKLLESKAFKSKGA